MITTILTKSARYGETFRAIEPELTGGEWYCASCGMKARTMRDEVGGLKFICISPSCADRFDAR